MRLGRDESFVARVSVRVERLVLGGGKAQAYLLRMHPTGISAHSRHMLQSGGEREKRELLVRSGLVNEIFSIAGRSREIQFSSDFNLTADSWRGERSFFYASQRQSTFFLPVFVLSKAFLLRFSAPSFSLLCSAFIARVTPRNY